MKWKPTHGWIAGSGAAEARVVRAAGWMASFFVLGVGCASPTVQEQPETTLDAGPLPATAPTLEAWRKTMSTIPAPKDGCFQASHPSTQWEEVGCTTAPAVPHSPANRLGSATVGNGNDTVALMPAILAWAEGSFPGVVNVTSETDNGVANKYSLQLNSNRFGGTPFCPSNKPIVCQGWQQFIYSNSSGAYMQYWLLGFGGQGLACPSGWFANGNDCYKNSPMMAVPAQSIRNLANLSLTGTAGSSDKVTMSTGGTTLYMVSQASVLNLYQNWTTAEFNVFGDCCSESADFNSGASIVVKIVTSSGTRNAPVCAHDGFTAETNNLTLANSCTVLGSPTAIQFHEQSNACIPFCAGMQCGADGCGGSCGSCPSGQTCQNNQCISQPPADRLVACNAAGDVMDDVLGADGRRVNDDCDDAAGSGEFQCDQFVNRYMSSLYLPPVDNWVNDLACQICDLVGNDPVYSVWGPGYRATAGHQPGPNDLLVWQESLCDGADKGAPGHVAVVTAAHPNYLEYIQQNWMVAAGVNGSAYAGLPRSSTSWDPNASWFGHPGGPGGVAFQPRCWVHLECPPGTSCNHGPGHNPCNAVPSAGNGQYCGACTPSQCQSGFNGAVADPNTVYECFDGEVANEKHCSRGCFVAAMGTPDDCNSSDPCAAVPSSENGTFCSNQNNHQFGFNSNGTAYPNTVYHCVNSHTVDVVSCYTGCTPAPAGSPDQCNNNPCAGVSGNNNGSYCGNSPSRVFNTAFADPDIAYNCVNGQTLDTVWCGDYGCQQEPSGTPDRCNNDPCSSVQSANNGVYCGASNQSGFNAQGTASSTTLYFCNNGHAKWAQICARGCYIAPAGIVDGCN